MLEVVFEDESIENDLDEALDTALVAQDDALEKRSDDADIRRVAVEHDDDSAATSSISSTVVKITPIKDWMYWYDCATMRMS